MPSSSEPGEPSPAFRSLIERSIEAGESIYFGAPDKRQARLDANRQHLLKLRKVDDILTGRQFWFFQRKEVFLSQTTVTKWSRDRLDDYVLLPIRDEFVDQQDCAFISHIWHSPAHPDPDGDDLRQLQAEFQDSTCRYVWLDWTCLPQFERSESEERYAYDGRELIANLIHHCQFTWISTSTFQPRVWVLYEVAEAFFLSTSDGPAAEDLQIYWQHLQEMRSMGVRRVLDKYQYKCAIESDLEFIIPRLALAVILKGLTAKVEMKQECVDQAVLARSRGLQVTVGKDTMYMNHYAGELDYHGMILRFPPFPKPALEKSSAKHSARHQKRLQEEYAAITGQEMVVSKGKEVAVTRTTGGFKEWMRRNFSMSYTT